MRIPIPYLVILTLCIVFIVASLSKCGNKPVYKDRVDTITIIKQRIDTIEKEVVKLKEAKTKIIYRTKFDTLATIDTVLIELKKCDTIVKIDSIIIQKQDTIIQDQRVIIDDLDLDKKELGKEVKREKRKRYLGYAVGGLIIAVKVAKVVFGF